MKSREEKIKSEGVHEHGQTRRMMMKSSYKIGQITNISLLVFAVSKASGKSMVEEGHVRLNKVSLPSIFLS